MVVHSLVRRGVEMASDHFSKNPDQKQPDIQVSTWLLVLCAFTSLAFVLAMWSVCCSLPDTHKYKYTDDLGRLHLRIGRCDSRCRRRYQP